MGRCCPWVLRHLMVIAIQVRTKRMGNGRKVDEMMVNPRGIVLVLLLFAIASVFRLLRARRMPFLKNRRRTGRAGRTRVSRRRSKHDH